MEVHVEEEEMAGDSTEDVSVLMDGSDYNAR